MTQNKFELAKNINGNETSEVLLRIDSKDRYLIEGNNFCFDGQGIIAHLLHIKDCDSVTVRNVIFKNGNTNVIRKISRKALFFGKKKVSIFEVIDGAGVLLTGNSNVTFENCAFENNRSIMCGGAVSNQSSGVVRFNNCVFRNNVAYHTGSAIDNLTANTHLIVEDSVFDNNVSNAKYNNSGPHGQISVFPRTKAIIKNSVFIGNTIPVDFYEGSDIELENLKFNDQKWEGKIFKRNVNSIKNRAEQLKNLWWVIPKTLGKVRYTI